MIFRLLLLFTIVPAIELVILLQIHHAIAASYGTLVGLLVTVGTIAFTGIVGAALARQQGLGVLRQLQTQMKQGQVPGQAIGDGVLILVGSAFLLTPGFLTDLVGFSLLIPVTRKLFRDRLTAWIQHRIRVQKSGGADVFVVDSVEAREAPIE